VARAAAVGVSISSEPAVPSIDAYQKKNVPSPGRTKEESSRHVDGKSLGAAGKATYQDLGCRKGARGTAGRLQRKKSQSSWEKVGHPLQKGHLKAEPQGVATWESFADHIDPKCANRGGFCRERTRGSTFDPVSAEEGKNRYRAKNRA